MYYFEINFLKDMAYFTHLFIEYSHPMIKAPDVAGTNTVPTWQNLAIFTKFGIT